MKPLLRARGKVLRVPDVPSGSLESSIWVNQADSNESGQSGPLGVQILRFGGWLDGPGHPMTFWKVGRGYPETTILITF